jgi:phosphate transport system substrate-binding protein
MKNIIVIVLLLSGLACGNYDRSGDSISSGTLKMGVDISYRLMMESEIDVFQEFYSDAKVNAQYLPETEVIQLLLKDSIQGAIINRKLTDEELKMFSANKRFPEMVRIAIDGVAFIVHPDNKDTSMTTDQIESIMSGKSKSWNELGGKSKGNIRVVIDNKASCNARFIREEFLHNSPIPENFFATEKNEDVIEYVAAHPEAIGVISVSWLSDREDATAKAIRGKVKTIGVINDKNKYQSKMARGPYQAYIYDQSYPYRRDVYAIRTGLKETVGTGFVSFLAGEKGQLIIHKMGMVAAKSPVRTIKIKQ